MPLAELLITRSTGGDIRLFTDHRAEEIQRLISSLPPMLRNGECPPVEHIQVARLDYQPRPQSQPQPQPPADPSAGAMETSSRLVDRHRDLRKPKS